MNTALALTIDASAARKGSADYIAAVNAIKASVTSLDKDTAGLFTKLKSGAKLNVDSTGAKTATTSVNSLEAATKRLALSSSAALRTSNSQFDRLYEKAERLGDVSGIRTLDQALARLEIRLQRAATPLDVRAARSQFADVASDVMRTNRQLEIVERKANIAAASMNKLSTAQQTSTGMFRAGNGALRQTSFQLSQIAQQGAVTGDYLRAAAIQIPDLLLPFGTVAILAGAALGAVAPLAIDILGAADASEEFKARLDSLKSVQDSLTQTTDLLKSSVVDLTGKYGDAAGKVRDLAAFQAGLRIAELTRQMNEQSVALEGVAGRYYTLNNGGHAFRNTLHRISKDFGLSGQAARAFETAIQSAATADTFDAQVTALQNVKRLLTEAGVPASDIPPELALALDKMIDLSNETDAAKKIAADLVKVVGDIAPSLDPAVSTAAALKVELAAALSLQNKINQQDSLTYSGRGQDPRQFENGPQYTRELSYTDPQTIIDQFNKRAKRASGGRSGGGRKAQLSDEQKATESLTKSIKDRLASLKNEAVTLELLTTGVYKHSEAATLAAQVMQQNGGVIDATTAAMLRQIEAQALLNEETERNTPIDLRQVTADSLRDGLKTGLSSALQGDTKNFAKNLATSVQSALADALSDKIVASLGIDQIFNVGGNTAALRMQTAIATGGIQAGNSIAMAMRTGQAASPASAGGAGGIFGFIGSLFGFDEGVANVSNAAPWQKLPQYAEGTANTSGGIPAILHDNEAVIPLSRGRKVPVDISGTTTETSKGIRDVNITTTVTVEGDANEDNANQIAEMISASVQHQIATQLSDAMAYGGSANPRGN